MRPRIKRHFDYVTASQTLPAASGIINVVLQTRLDAPFVLRSIAARATFGSLSPASAALVQFANSDGKYYQNAPIALGLTSGSLFSATAPIPLSGQAPNGVYTPSAIVYPPGSAIYANVQNPTASDITGFQLFFRGYQLFECGQIPDLTYPRQASANPYSYVVGTLTQPLSLPVQMAAPLTNIKIPGNNVGGGQQNTDADFAARTARCYFTTSNGQYPQEVFVRLRDWNEKAYSNDLIHIDILFGALGGLTAFSGEQLWAPGLFTPEIYVPANQYLQMDLQRTDGAQIGFFATENFTVGFRGSKVYRQ
jgi:hypothetical protein